MLHVLWSTAISIKHRILATFNLKKINSDSLYAFIEPIITYNSEISFMDSYLKLLYRVTLRAEKSNSEIDELNFIDKTAIEKVYLGFCKSTLGVKNNSTNLAVRAELGRLPLAFL